MGAYQEAYRESLERPEEFWARAAAEAVDWVRAPEQVLDASRPPFYRWFPDGELNTCANALDRHVAAGRGDTVALIYDSPVTGTVRRYTYAVLRDEVARAAGAIASLGVGRGDRVIVYLPMIPEAVINVAGHRLSTGVMEAVLAAHPAVAECAVI
jgi:propionyl-CoA synthetase